MRKVDPHGRETRILNRLADFDGKTVLDVGCGEGRTTRRVARRAASVLGIDPDAEAIARAREMPARRTGEMTFSVADVVALELPRAAFDVVLFSRSL